VADDKVRGLIHRRAPENKLFLAAESAGLRSMREDGQRLIDHGITSREEVLRVTGESADMALAGPETSRFGELIAPPPAVLGPKAR
jgi:hypothetical protein